MLSRMLSRFNHLKTPDSDNLPSITRNFQLLEMEQVNTPRLLLFPLQRPFDRQFAHRCRRELESLKEPQAQGHQLPCSSTAPRVPRNTRATGSPPRPSQTCNCCGVRDPKSRRSQAEFHCAGYGYQANADHNAAINIADRGRYYLQKDSSATLEGIRRARRDGETIPAAGRKTAPAARRAQPAWTAGDSALSPPGPESSEPPALPSLAISSTTGKRIYSPSTGPDRPCLGQTGVSETANRTSHLAPEQSRRARSIV